MNKVFVFVIFCLLISLKIFTQPLTGKNLYEFDSSSSPRWSSFENMTAEKGRAAMENNGAKGHPSDGLDPGETKVLLNVKTPGIINRIWITIIDRSPEMLRSLKIEMFWEDAKKPAVSVPFGDFFGMGLGKTASFHNTLFANPEGRSFMCFIPMPFKKAARIQITNESGKRLSHIFYDINFQQVTKWNEDNLYFHAYWHRDTATELAKDFELLPEVYGRGRFLGVNVGVNANPVYENYWWGEGEVKMYIDGDKEFPTLAGTGTEDYIGTAWGQGEFFNDYSGCLLANKDSMGWAFYRYHIPDPIFFKTDCKVTLQQMGGNRKELVAGLQSKGVPLIPVGLDDTKKPVQPLYKKGTIVDLKDPSLSDGFSNFYRTDDVSATAYFYLGSASNDLPALQPLSIRLYNLKKKK
ncbi:MAG: glycoside hydrolase family 172 protein [Ferruginibacter sp.]